MASLAERRKSRGPLISDGNDASGEMDKLKQYAEANDREKGTNILEEISEEDLPEEDELDLRARRGGGKAESESAQDKSLLNIPYGVDASNLNLSSSNLGDRSRGEGELDLTEEWVHEDFVTLHAVNSKLVDFFYLTGKMICVFEDFQVEEIDLKTKEVSKSYNL